MSWNAHRAAADHASRVIPTWDPAAYEEEN